ncbi:hypothetical protein JTE90_022606 [Oedothorax gibbosus]|uniref:Uncharacterized protein n=1 Tax=Oedothorax gibbosus TaxID=931172 RepID=A0AAV6TU95_9ARAC|nr:hypothetical protein JTE90_022606 [Oedothorax gibbosus]
MARVKPPSSKNLSDDKAIWNKFFPTPILLDTVPFTPVFWGELARQWFKTIFRPVPKTLKPLRTKTDNLGRLYDVDVLYAWQVDRSVEYALDSKFRIRQCRPTGNQPLSLELFLRVNRTRLVSSLSQTGAEVSPPILGRVVSFLSSKDDKIRIFLKNISVAHETVPKSVCGRITSS